jgi:DNA-directed RNA polymerase subunit M/transcription elongation factor TFIIS
LAGERRRDIIPTMATQDAATEWRRLSELYGKMADGELLALARKQSELTDVAQEALANEMSFRKLKLQAEEPAIPKKPERPLDPAYDDDRKLVEIRVVWSLADALQLQQLLDQAGIPFFMGAEMATGVDVVTSSFVNGVSVKIMNIGVPWAQQALRYYEPENEPEAEKQEEETADLVVRCPKCHSTEVVFDSVQGEESASETDSTEQFEWTCDDCGHRWTDDGIVRGA